MAAHIVHTMKEAMHLGMLSPEAKERSLSHFFSKLRRAHSNKSEIEEEMRAQSIEERMQQIKARAFLQQF